MIDQRGLSLVELLLALVVLAAAGGALYASLGSYIGATKQDLQSLSPAKPLGQTRLVADLETLANIRTQLDLYNSTHETRPPTRDALAAILNPPPRFQCAGNDYTYDPTSGAVSLLVMEQSRCQ